MRDLKAMLFFSRLKELYRLEVCTQRPVHSEHDRSMQQGQWRQIELHGYRTDIGLDGFPTDPNHPFNRARSSHLTLAGGQRFSGRAGAPPIPVCKLLIMLDTDL
jgi:hypothetical protein